MPTGGVAVVGRGFVAIEICGGGSFHRVMSQRGGDLRRVMVYGRLRLDHAQTCCMVGFRVSLRPSSSRLVLHPAQDLISMTLMKGRGLVDEVVGLSGLL